MPTLKQLINGIRYVERKHYKNRLHALEGAPLRRGTIYKIAIMTPRKPNSAKRKIAKLRFTLNYKKVFANIPGIGHNLHEYSVVLARGGSAKDLPGVNYTLIKGKLDFSATEFIHRTQARSKYGLKKR